MGSLRTAVVACSAILVAVACTSFEAAPENPEGGAPGGGDAGTDSGASDAAPDGARPPFSCSGALFCERFDTAASTANLAGTVNTANANHALVGAVATPERHLEVTVGGKLSTKDTNGQIVNTFPGALDTYEISMNVSVSILTNVELCALNFDLPTTGVYGIYVVVRGNRLAIADYANNNPDGGPFVSNDLDLGPVPEATTFALGVYVNRTTRQATVYVDGKQLGKTYTALFPPAAKSVTFYYGPFSERAHVGTTVSYDDVKLTGR